jgi:hypothetical protein
MVHTGIVVDALRICNSGLAAERDFPRLEVRDPTTLMRAGPGKPVADSFIHAG